MFTLKSCCCLISQNQIDSLAISFNFKKLKITSLCPIPINSNSNSNSNALDLMLIVTRLYIKMQHINALSGLGIRMIFFCGSGSWYFQTATAPRGQKHAAPALDDWSSLAKYLIPRLLVFFLQAAPTPLGQKYAAPCGSSSPALLSLLKYCNQGWGA